MCEPLELFNPSKKNDQAGAARAARMVSSSIANGLPPPESQLHTHTHTHRVASPHRIKSFLCLSVCESVSKG